ncbi:PilZ domain-containing protein [Sphingomonas sp. MA1305]|uniref:PilZ domain-containing protein n=1 Tax=Sphingomonas sp. MA1305 TaxID=2479204 RepID=UPI0018E0511E|nr:PilZ domain-containing protein [Sphingomonas sp. MA1305]MBI0476896.1 PilZ domain-containing protein [Sphingomonas sp. MA1305]
MDQSLESPRQKRSSVIVRAYLHVPGLPRPMLQRVRNLSLTGACVEHHGELKADMPIIVDMGLLEGLPAMVMWVTDRLAGLNFAQPIDLEAARRPRSAAASGTPASNVQVGWMDEMRHAYRR